MLTDEERAAMQAIGAAYAAVRRIGKDRLIANGGELVAAVHVMQSFVQQHVLHRLEPDYWSAWYTDEPEPV